VIAPYDMLLAVAREFKGLPNDVSFNAAAILKALLILEREGDASGQLELFRIACDRLGVIVGARAGVPPRRRARRRTRATSG
jgi:hypothetical protein